MADSIVSSKKISLQNLQHLQQAVMGSGVAPSTPPWSNADAPATPTSNQLQPLARLDRTSWDNFSGKARWDCLVALRGPDLRGSSGVKMVTTSVIRHRLSGCMRVGGLVNSSISFVILPSSPPIDRTFDWSHFCGHVQEAAGWLGIPVAFISTDAWLENVVNSGGSSSMWEKLIPELKEPFSSALAKLFKRGESAPVSYDIETGGDL